MKFLADENLDKSIVLNLREMGYDVQYISEISPGIMDDQVIQLGLQSDRIIITSDKDFGKLSVKLSKKSFGVILCRLHGLSKPLKRRIIQNLILNSSEELSNSFTVLSKTLIRIRKLPN